MSFKELDQSQDVSTQLSVVNEIIPLTGSFFTGSAAFVQKYLNITSGSAVSGGFWETIYDGAPTSTSSSALIDLTYGFSDSAALDDVDETFLKIEKKRTYEQMANLLLGTSTSIFDFGGTNFHDLFFLLMKRRIYKDEIKKGSVAITIQVSGAAADTLTLADTGAASTFTVGQAGDEASLFSGTTAVGKVFYNAGIVAFKTGVFQINGGGNPVYWSGTLEGLHEVAITGTIDNVVDGLRNRINQIEFQNQTNLHSTIYFCRALNSEFNYSTNPTFVDSDGRIIPTSGTDNQTRAYATTISLFDINDNILAVAKLSEPVKKSPDNEVVFRVRLSY
jgi:hypothetical protein